jgi:PKD repeat protein
VNGDTTYEVNETFFVNLSGANNATLADAQGVGTILNDDANLAPTANAGPDQIVFVSTLVTLDGSTSSDADGHLPLAYRWTQLSGTPVVLNSNVISRPTFTSPATPAILTFRLIVTDTVGAPSTADTVVVTVTDRLLAGLSLTASLPVTATKPATFTTNITSGTNVTYTWQFGDGTPVVVNGSVITHTYATPGIYTVIVTATNSVSIITKTLVVTVNPAIIVLPPTVFKTYLPIVMKSSAPDLVGSFSLSPNKNNFAAGEPVTIFVTVTNQGNAAAGPFWVDFYINPSPVPTTNVIWNYACNMNPCLGLAWYVEGLAPGQSIVLTSLPGSYGAAYSRWYGWFASGTSDLYVYVDVWNPPVPTGGVLESNETNNRSERHGLVVTGTNPALPSPLGLEEIPTRPQPR